MCTLPSIEYDDSSRSSRKFYNHDLFAVVKLLSVNSGVNARKKVKIKEVAVGGFVGNAIIALFCSNSIDFNYSFVYFRACPHFKISTYDFILWNDAQY